MLSTRAIASARAALLPHAATHFVGLLCASMRHGTSRTPLRSLACGGRSFATIPDCKAGGELAQNEGAKRTPKGPQGIPHDTAVSIGGRITSHPVLDVPQREEIPFSWNGMLMKGLKGEPLSSALVANGVHVFGHHVKDNSPQGLFCASGQCSQCMVLINGEAAKSCMTPVAPGMKVEAADHLPVASQDAPLTYGPPPPIKETDVLVIGGGPAGVSAAMQLGMRDIGTILIDDKDCLGGKLVLQTHKFFGTREDCYAGTRGFEIGRIIDKDVRQYSSVDVWTNTTAVGVFSDGLVGVMKGKEYVMIKPKRLLVASGAREKFITFPGNTLPGVFGAGAFQTLVNRDLVKCSERLLVIGGGNVGLIAAYHAMQAGIHVVGLLEASKQVRGYRVHSDKIKRLGIPIFTQHTIVNAFGKDHLEGVTVTEVDENYCAIPGTEKKFAVDTLLLAVGLEKCDEFHQKAVNYGITSWKAGDANEIAEASSAMFTGKIRGLEIAKSLGHETGEIPADWLRKEQVLKEKPGPMTKREGLPVPPDEAGIFPVMHCYQTMPCNVCVTACRYGQLKVKGDSITGIPYFQGCEVDDCEGCMRCVASCPGMAVTVVDFRDDVEHPLVTLAHELDHHFVEEGMVVPVTDTEGEVLGSYPVEEVEVRNGRTLVTLRVDHDIARRVASLWHEPEDAWVGAEREAYEEASYANEAIVCRCERVTAGELRKLIKEGMTDENQLKALTRAGMGSCGSKTCHFPLERIFREEGVPYEKVSARTIRPLYVEVPLGAFAPHSVAP